MKNNNKAIADIQGKSLLFDDPLQGNEKFSGNVWRYNNRADYKRKMLLKEKFVKNLGIKMVKDNEQIG